MFLYHVLSPTSTLRNIKKNCLLSKSRALVIISSTVWSQMRFFLCRQEYLLSLNLASGTTVLNINQEDICNIVLQSCHILELPGLWKFFTKSIPCWPVFTGQKWPRTAQFLLWSWNFQSNNSTGIIVTMTHQEPCKDTLYFDSCFWILNFQLCSKDQMPCSLFLTNHPFYCFWHSYPLCLIKNFIYVNGAFA